MKRILLAIGMSVICAGVSTAQTLSGIEVSAGGANGTLPLTSDGTGSISIAGGPTFYGEEWSGQTTVDGVQFNFTGVDPATNQQLGVVYNSDPFIVYSYSVTNTLTSSINVNANIPVVSISQPAGTYSLTSSLGLTLTNGNPSGGSVTVSPTSVGGAEQQDLVNGVDVSPSIDLGTSSFSVATLGASDTTHYASGPLWYSFSSPITSFGVNTSFTLTPGASLGVTGFFDLQALNSTPEPSSLGLSILAVGCFAFLMFRTRRRA